MHFHVCTYIRWNRSRAYALNSVATCTRMHVWTLKSAVATAGSGKLASRGNALALAAAAKPPWFTHVCPKIRLATYAHNSAKRTRDNGSNYWLKIEKTTKKGKIHQDRGLGVQTRCLEDFGWEDEGEVEGPYVFVFDQEPSDHVERSCG
jgi:hypothetical protein